MLIRPETSSLPIDRMNLRSAMQLPLSIDDIIGKFKNANPSASTAAISWNPWTYSIVTKTQTSKDILLVSLIYLRRVERRLHAGRVSVSLSPLALLIAVLIIASKGHHDRSFANSAWIMYSEVGYDG
jgi:hypothetical protein